MVATLHVDRFDRRPVLLVTYAGFALGTLACALSHSYWQLFAARIVSGAFGGVSAALVMTIVSDVVPPARRAAAIGIVMTAFSAASALGVPVGLVLAQQFNWESPFLLISLVASAMWVVAFRGVPSMRAHISDTASTGKWRALVSLVGNQNVQWSLLLICLMMAAHFTIIPFLSPYLVANVGIPESALSWFYMTGGILTAFTGPVVGRWADRYGRWKMYVVMTLVASGVIAFLTNAPPMALWGVLVLGAFFFVFASGRFVPGQALTSLAVLPAQRGAFMSFSSCLRDLVAGAVSGIGGFIVTRTGQEGPLEGYHWLGVIAITCGLLSILVARQVREVG